MQKLAASLGLCVLFSLPAHAASTQPESCTRIREQIDAQTMVLPRPNTVLLGKLSMHEECRFSAAEAYRAAYGAKPFPGGETGGKSHGHRHGRDDD